MGKPPKSSSNAIHQNPIAFLIIDMFNTLDFPEGRRLLENALPVAYSIRDLKKRLKAEGIPIIYVNDNFGQWRSEQRKVFESCSAPESLGHELAELLEPDEDDYFVLKPKHSGFYSTTLHLLLKELGAKTLIISGIAGNICVLFTANDAHMRDFKVCVPEDCIASNTREDNDYALRQMREVFGVNTSASTQLTLESL